MPTASWDTTFGDPRFFTRDTSRLGQRWDTRATPGARRFAGAATYDHYRLLRRVSRRGRELRRRHEPMPSAGSCRRAAVRPARRHRGRRTSGSTCGRTSGTATRRRCYVDDRRSSRRDRVLRPGRDHAHAEAHGDRRRPLRLVESTGGTGRPRLGLVYRTEHDTAIKVLYGEAYRAPNRLRALLLRAPEGTLATGDRPGDRPDAGGRRRTSRRAPPPRERPPPIDTRISDLIDARSDDDGRVFLRQRRVGSIDGRRGRRGESAGRPDCWCGAAPPSSAPVRRRPPACRMPPGSSAPLQIAVPMWRRQLTIGSDTTFTSWTTDRRRRAAACLLAEQPHGHLPAARWPIVVGASLYNVFDARYSHPVGVEFRQPSLTQDGRSGAVRLAVHF